MQDEIMHLELFLRVKCSAPGDQPAAEQDAAGWDWLRGLGQVEGASDRMVIVPNSVFSQGKASLAMGVVREGQLCGTGGIL